MKKIHILGPNPEAFSNELSSLFPEVNFSIGSSRDDFGDSIDEYDILFAFSDFLSPHSFRQKNKN